MPVTDTANVSDLYASLPLPRESTFIRVLDVHGSSSPEESDGSIQCDLRVINLESENHPSFATLSYRSYSWSHGQLPFRSTALEREIWESHYQEILLASNPVIVCGGFHLAWARFSLGVTFLEYSGINYRQGHPMITTVNTWAQLASSRDYLISTHATGFANIQSSRRKDMSQTTLQRYREFIIYISEIVARLRRINVYLMLFGLAIVFVCAMVWIMLRNLIGSPAIVSTVPSEVVSAATKASSSAAACVVACATSDIAACAEACEAASSAASSVSLLSSDLNNKRTYQTLDRVFGPLVGTVFLAFSVSFIVFLGSARRKQPRLEHVPIAQNAGIDLVDGICSRKSKEKKDKAIGVQAVLQRLSKTAILPIHNAHSLEYMYKQLCVQLLEVTDSLQFLLPASMNSFPKHPSWVPNWAAEFDSFWLKSTLFRNRPGTATPGSRAYWRLDPRKDNILSVRGRQLCTVARCFRFRETFDMYDPSQWELHRENLRCILQCPPLFEKQDKTVSSILKQMSDFKLQPPINERQIHAWKLFMRERRHQNPETLLSVLEGRDSMFAPSVRFHNWIRGRSSLRTLLHTQISICNSLAKKGRIVFATTQFHIEIQPAMRGAEAFLGVDRQQETSWMPRSIGVGSCNARAGDSVVLIAGVFSPLIIRRDSVSTRIVSPAAVQGVMEGEKWDRRWKAEDLEEFILS